MPEDWIPPEYKEELVRAAVRRQMYWDEWLYNKVESRVKLPDKVVEVLAGEWVLPWFCRLGLGHAVVMDHCGLPEHDYCIGCHRLFPGQARERRKGMHE